jgi:uncharacterized membrane protein
MTANMVDPRAYTLRRLDKSSICWVYFYIQTFNPIVSIGCLIILIAIVFTFERISPGSTSTFEHSTKTDHPRMLPQLEPSEQKSASRFARSG